jgi:hypothetical protein
MASRLVLLRSVRSYVDAQMLKAFLESKNIEVRIDSLKFGDMGGAYPSPFSLSSQGIRLLVQEKDLKTAKQFLKDASL